MDTVPPLTNIRLTVPFFMVCDMEASLKFYIQVKIPS